MRIRSRLPAMDEAAVRAAIEGLPMADGYELIVQPLRYRSAPHLAAYTVFDDKTITLQVPEPFYPFGEVVHFGAKRLAASGLIGRSHVHHACFRIGGRAAPVRSTQLARHRNLLLREAHRRVDAFVARR